MTTTQACRLLAHALRLHADVPAEPGLPLLSEVPDDWKDRASLSVNEHRDHGIVDTKGRAVGGRIIVRPYFRCVTGEKYGEFGFSVHRYSGQWDLNCQATRNGNSFGASTRDKTYPSKAAALAAVDATFEAQRKRYAKKFGTEVL
jgi:hypothetical protein